jgi:hypothetical protein
MEWDKQFGHTSAEDFVRRRRFSNKHFANGVAYGV